MTRPILYSKVQTARHYGVHRDTITRWIERGCPVWGSGRVYRFDFVEVNRWLKRQAKSAAERKPGGKGAK